jgi:hypothetical protein
MEDVLAVYTRPHDPNIPLVCLDETSKQLIAETRAPIQMKEGRPARFDYEYERNGTANLFMMFTPLEGWRHVKVTDRHTAVDYAHALKELADIHFLNAKKIVLAQDNLNTHTKASPIKLFPPPKQGGWPNGSNGTTRPSTAVGSIWQSPNSASFRPSASIGASQTNKPSPTKSQLGTMIEMPTTPRPIGNSPQQTPVSNSSIFTRQSD